MLLWLAPTAATQKAEVQIPRDPVYGKPETTSCFFLTSSYNCVHVLNL
jgi:hypothetical protein